MPGDKEGAMGKTVSGYLKAMGLFRQEVRLLLLCTASMWLALSIHGVVFNLFLLRLDYTPAFVGLVRAVGALSAAGFVLVAGLLGQRLGSRKMLLGGFSLAAISYLLMAVTHLLQAPLRSGWLLANSILFFTSYGTFFASSAPFIMQHTGEVERNHAFSAWAMLPALIGFAGGLLGGLLPGVLTRVLGLAEEAAAPYGYSLLVSGVLALACIPILARTRRDEVPVRHVAARGGTAAPLAIISFFALFSFFRVMGEHAILTFFNVYLDVSLGISTAQIGAILAIGPLVSVPAALAYPWFAARWGTFRTIVFSVAATGLAFAPLILIAHWSAAALTMVGMSAAVMIVNSATMVYSQSLVPAEWRSTISGAVIMASALGIGAISAAGGVLVGVVGYRAFFGAGAALTLGAVPIFWAYFRVPRGEFAGAAGEPSTLQPEAVTSAAD
jgi:MFS family permease